MKKNPELLAPVGGIEQLKAAVENGADAVYLGGKLLNARINADNFDDETMREAVCYAHLRNVKVYVTMNILIKDQELEPAIHYAKYLYEIGVDALIIQDLGLARLIRRRLPSMKIHLSTQATIYNVSGVRAAKKLGFERVVLARELSLKEIKNITKENLVEIEVFIHGALCICYSGQCQMSRILGGRSGNRGLCAQPCRLPFTVEGKAETEHLLSPKDLCTIDYLGELVEAGVASLKIEGRMKSPEYVAIVTSIYRKYLDEYLQKGSYKVSEEDRQKLNQVFNRGGFTEGYLEGNQGEEMMSTVLPKHQGTYLGKVVASAERDLIDVELEGPLNIGDGVEIQNKNMPGNVVTYLKPLKGNLVRIGDIKGKVWTGDKVYKITDKALMQWARESFDDQSSQATQYYKKAKVNARFKANLGEYPTLAIIDKGVEEIENAVIKVSVSGSTLAEKAINRSLTIENVNKQLCKTGDVPFRIIDIDIIIEEGISLPTSTINQMRREAFELLIFEKTKKRSLSQQEINQYNQWAQHEKQCGMETIDQDEEQRPKSLTLYFHTAQGVKESIIRNTVNKLKAAGVEWITLFIYVPLYDFIEAVRDGNNKFLKLEKSVEGCTVVPYLPTITKGAFDKYMEENMEFIVKCCKECGVAVGNLGWIDELRSRAVKVYGNYGLNLYNSEAIAWAKDTGLTDYVLSHEVFKNIERGEEEYEKCMFAGMVPLMVSEHNFLQKVFVDRKNKRFLFLKEAFNEKHMLVNMDENIEITIDKVNCHQQAKRTRIYFN